MQNTEVVSQSLSHLDFQVRDRFRELHPPPKVLIVEDDEVVLEALCRQVRRYDPSLTVFSATSTAEAQKMIHDFAPDLLITDYYLDHENTAVDLIRLAEKGKKPVSDALVISTGAPLPALFAAEREGLKIKFVKKPVDRFLLYRFLQFDLDRGYYL